MSLRDTNIDRMRDGAVDVAIVGGGINGAVTAASLAGRGASVALIDRADFGLGDQSAEPPTWSGAVSSTSRTTSFHWSTSCARAATG